MVASAFPVSQGTAVPSPLVSRQVEVVRISTKTNLAALAVLAGIVLVTTFALAGTPVIPLVFLTGALVMVALCLCDEPGESPVMIQDPYRTWVPSIRPYYYAPPVFIRPHVPTYIPPCVRIIPPPARVSIETHTRVGGGHVAPMRIVPPVRPDEGTRVVVGSR